MVVFDDMKTAEKLMIYDKGVSVISGEDIEYDDYVVKTRDGDVWLPYIKQEDALYNSLEHFREIIEQDKQSITGTDQAIRIQKILEKADQGMNQ